MEAVAFGAENGRHDLKSSGTDLFFSLSRNPSGGIRRAKIVANIGNLRAYALSGKIMQSAFARLAKTLKTTNQEAPSIFQRGCRGLRWDAFHGEDYQSTSVYDSKSWPAIGVEHTMNARCKIFGTKYLMRTRS